MNYFLFHCSSFLLFIVCGWLKGDDGEEYIDEELPQEFTVAPGDTELVLYYEATAATVFHAEYNFNLILYYYFTAVYLRLCRLQRYSI
jgi:hypothetical protein